jgi:aspartate aminotransferase
MQQLSARINSLSESATLAMTRKSRALSAKGLDVINLSLGEPDFDTPDFVKEAAKAAIDNNFTHYMPVPGYLSLREAISNKFKRDNNLDYAADQIVVSTGAKQSISNVVMALIGEGDEVLLPAPYWVSYIEMVKMAEGTPVPVATSIDSDFKLTPGELEAAITPNTRLMIFSSPCNPSGSVYSNAELGALAAVIAKYPKLMVIADEIYEHINFVGGHHSLGTFSEVSDQIITVNGVSKGFAMTGWRVGYLGAPKWVAAACTKMQGQVTSGTCSIAQKAAEAAMNADPSSVKDMCDAFLKRRDLILGLLKEVPGVNCNVPEGAFYVFPDVTHYFGKSNGDEKINNATDLAMYLLNTAHVAVVTGDAFGSPASIRISYACADEIIHEAVARISEALAKLS